MSRAERRIWFIRHGERLDFVDPNWPNESEFPHDSPLSAVGKEQAEDTAEYLKDEPIDKILCSPFLRTLQTALPFAETFRMPMGVEHGLSEVFFQRWFPAAPLLPPPRSHGIKRVDNDYYSQVFPIYPETEITIVERCFEMAQYLRRLEGNIICVTHGGVLWHLISALTGARSAVHVGFCCLIRVVLVDGKWILDMDGSDDSHLRVKDKFNRIA